MSQPLNVTIIGAGIAGTLAARVLRETNNVTILEKSRAQHELGAAINLGPNASEILDKYGFDRTKTGSVVVGRSRVLDIKGNVVLESPLPDLRALFGSEWTVQHRVDLWNELFRLATAPSEQLGLTGQPAKVIWGADVAKVDVESGDVTTMDGRVIHSDLVVGADGIKSMVRQCVVGEAAFSTARPSGSSAFRFLLSRDVVNKVAPGLAVMDPTKPADIEIHLAQDATKRSIVCYPCRNFQFLNFGALGLDSHIKLETTESWSSTGTREDLLRCFNDYTYLRPLLEYIIPRLPQFARFPSLITTTILYDDLILLTERLNRQADNIKLWQLRDQDPLPTYIRGRTVIIGDAAHAMTPHQGQGASQAIEDAEGFSLFTDQVISRDGVPEVLKDFDRVRRTRASKIQNITRDVHQNKTPENIWKNMKYNFSYDGVRASMAKLDAGQEI